jgi:branched-chain amino acid aminotransferase
MAAGTNLRTYFDGRWQEGNVPVMRAGDHGAWLGSTVFDGARYVEGIAPDLDKHLARVNRSAEALMIRPTVSVEEMLEIVWEGLRLYPADAPVYIRPMYWGIDSSTLGILPSRRTRPVSRSVSKRSRSRPPMPPPRSPAPGFAVRCWRMRW